MERRDRSERTRSLRSRPGSAFLPPRLGVDLPGLHDRLLRWFARVGRDLPWREGRDPYRVWISEVMLQQTQVERVVDHWRRFLERFPTVDRLAAAPLADVLRAWEGLGYYRRARQLHDAAVRIVAEHGGRVPASSVELATLPGIGRYTASAIASIAFGEVSPIVEANSRRVLARLAAHAAPLAGTSGDGPLWGIAGAILPARRTGEWNQALMDLGALVCTPRAPLCPRCPIAVHCEALATGRVATIPAIAPPRAIEKRREEALVIQRSGRVLVVRRGAGEWWEGLWDFPRLPAADLRAATGCGRKRRLASLDYTVTHHRVTVTISIATATRAGGTGRDRRWVEWRRLDGLAMTSPGRRIARLAAESCTKPATPGSRRRRRASTG